MSLTVPLPTSQFLDLFHVAEITLMLNWRQQKSGDGASEDIYAARAPSQWIAQVTTGDLTHAVAAGVQARINSLLGGTKRVLLYDSSFKFPSNDPLGLTWTAAAPTPTLGVITDRTHAAFVGMPNTYGPVLYGAYFSVLYDTDRRSLHQFAETWTSGGGGAVAAVEFSPPLPSAISAGAAVTLYKPVGKFTIEPDSVRPSVTSGKHKRLTFSATSTLKRG